MGRVFHPLLFLLARCTKNELISPFQTLFVRLARTRNPEPQWKVVVTIFSVPNGGS